MPLYCRKKWLVLKDMWETRQLFSNKSSQFRPMTSSVYRYMGFWRCRISWEYYRDSWKNLKELLKICRQTFYQLVSVVPVRWFVSFILISSVRSSCMILFKATEHNTRKSWLKAIEGGKLSYNNYSDMIWIRFILISIVSELIDIISILIIIFTYFILCPRFPPIIRLLSLLLLLIYKTVFRVTWRWLERCSVV